MTISINFNLPFDEAIQAMASRGVVLPDSYYGKLQGIHRQLSASIADVAKLDQLKAVFDSLTDTLKNGGTFAQWQQHVDVNNLGLAEHRLDNIFRTNIQQAYNSGQWQHALANKTTHPYLLYDAINDSRTRPTHKANDGIIRKIDDPIWKRIWFSRNVYRCRCRLIALTEQQAIARSGDGLGIHKTATEDPKRDTAWDNVDVLNAEVMGFGVDRAIAKRMTEGKVDKVLLSVFNKSIADGKLMTYQHSLLNAKSLLNSTEFEHFYQNHEVVGNFVVGVLSEIDKAIFLTSSNTVLMSKESLEHHKIKHPEITIEDYRKLPDIISNGEVYETQYRRFVLLRLDGKTYRAAMKITQNGDEAYFLSLVKQSDVKSDKEIRGKFNRIR
jgi:SPP1 gp7 family putative phage head morphogenesis protein